MDACDSQATQNRKLAREIIVILVFKVLTLGLIWVLFFSSPPEPHPNPETTATHLLGGSVSHIQVRRGVFHD